MGKDGTKRVNSVQFTFRKNSDEVQVRIRPGKTRDEFFKIPEYLGSKLSELVWERNEEQVVSRFTRLSAGKYLAGSHLLDDNAPKNVGGLVPSDSLSYSLERFLQEKYSILKRKDGVEYTLTS